MVMLPFFQIKNIRLESFVFRHTLLTVVTTVCLMFKHGGHCLIKYKETGHLRLIKTGFKTLTAHLYFIVIYKMIS